MTLMSKTRHNFRRVFTLCVALLQLSTLPATYLLHVGCEHARDDENHEHGLIAFVVSCFSGHHCSCTHHSPNRSSNSESPSREEPHDSESCPVCQAAFATATADFFAPRLATVGTVSLLAEPEVAGPASRPQYRIYSRGPPG